MLASKKLGAHLGTVVHGLRIKIKIQDQDQDQIQDQSKTRSTAADRSVRATRASLSCSGMAYESLSQLSLRTHQQIEGRDVRDH
jgi:hypothetical protein